MKEEAEALLLQAREHYAHYNMAAGHACIDRAITLDPANEVYLLLERAKVRYEQIEDSKGAIADLIQIIEKSQVIEEVAEARRLRNRTYRYEGQREAALEDINWVIERTPTAADYAQRAETHGWAYNYDAFMADYGRAIELDPTNCEYRSIRATHYVYQENFEAALSDLNEIVQWCDNEDDQMGARGSRLICFDALGRKEELLADLNWLIEHHEENASHYAWRAHLRITEQDFEGALADYNAALALSPNIPLFHRMRAWINFELGHYQTAVDELTTLVSNEEHPRVLSDYYNLRGQAYLSLGEEQQALDDFNAIMRLNDLPLYERASDYDEQYWFDEVLKKDAEQRGSES